MSKDNLSHEVLKTKGNDALKSGDPHKAIKLYTRAIKISKKSVYFHNRGVAYMTLKQFKKALRDFNTSIELDKKYLKAYFKKSIVLEQTGRIHEAGTTLLQAIQATSAGDYGYDFKTNQEHKKFQTKWAGNDPFRKKILERSLFLTKKDVQKINQKSANILKNASEASEKFRGVHEAMIGVSTSGMKSTLYWDMMLINGACDPENYEWQWYYSHEEKFKDWFIGLNTKTKEMFLTETFEQMKRDEEIRSRHLPTSSFDAPRDLKNVIEESIRRMVTESGNMKKFFAFLDAFSHFNVCMKKGIDVQQLIINPMIHLSDPSHLDHVEVYMMSAIEEVQIVVKRGKGMKNKYSPPEIRMKFFPFLFQVVKCFVYHLMKRERKTRLEKKACGFCRKIGDMKCSACKQYYCSQKCQKTDWKKHKLVCKK